MSDPVLELLTKGGVAAVLAVFAYLFWRALESRGKEQREDRAKADEMVAGELRKQTETMNRMLERLIRMDQRTARLAGSRAKTPTPFWPRRPGDPEDEEKPP